MAGRRLALGASYALLFVVAFVFFLWRSLPYREIGAALEARLRNRGLDVELAGVGPGGILGFRAASVRVRPAGAGVALPFSDAVARPEWTRVIRGEPAVSFEARFAGGTVAGEVGVATTAFLSIAWERVTLGRIPRPPPWDEVPLEGTARGTLTVDDLRKSLQEAEVESRAEFAGVRVGPGTVQGVPVPEMALGNGTVDLKIADGKADIREARFQGGDLEVLLNGASVLLRRPLGRSLVNGMLTLAPNDKAREDLALLFALFPGSPGSDGRYTARIRGSLEGPRLLRR